MAKMLTLQPGPREVPASGDSEGPLPSWCLAQLDWRTGVDVYRKEELRGRERGR